jgi:hypothetical protein
MLNTHPKYPVAIYEIERSISQSAFCLMAAIDDVMQCSGML